MLLHLSRLHETDRETLGTLETEDHRSLCVTLERPNLDNQPKVSRIPAGTYTCHRRHSPHFHCDVFQVMDVPGRDFIEIHPANYVSQLEGCIGVGLHFADINSDGVMDVVSSKAAFAKLMGELATTNTFTLTITDPE